MYNKPVSQKEVKTEGEELVADKHQHKGTECGKLDGATCSKGNKLGGQDKLTVRSCSW